MRRHFLNLTFAWLVGATAVNPAQCAERVVDSANFKSDAIYVKAMNRLQSAYSKKDRTNNRKSVTAVTGKLNFIISQCLTSNQACSNIFERYYRENQEHASSGGFLGLFEAQSFWGTGQELHYTEVEMPWTAGDGRVLEYQVGYGYIIAARQVDANMKGKGFLDSTPVAIKGKGGGTRFWGIIAGLAPDKIRSTKSNADDKVDCGSDDLDPQSEMLCTLDMQPTVTQRYFRDANARLANAMDRVRREYREPRKAGTLSSICPQVIDFRWKSPDASGSRAITEKNVERDMLRIARAINDALSVACINERPNAKIVYRDGTATDQWMRTLRAAKNRPDDERDTTENQTPQDGVTNADISIGDGGISADLKSLTQEYQRSSTYLTLTAKTSRELNNDDVDHRVEIKMEGLSKTAKLPSILASIVNYEREDISQHLGVKLQCSGGTDAVAVPTNPVANAVAYTELVDNARRVVDGDGDDCRIASGNFD